MLARINRLVDPENIRSVWKTGKKIKTDYFLAAVSCIQEDTSERFCFVVSKRVGSAVRRNLVKRRLRTLARGCLGCSFRNRDVVVRVFPSVNKASFLQLRDSWDFFRAKVDQL